MSNRTHATHTTLAISLCLMSGLPLGCDAPDDDLGVEVDELELEDLDESEELTAAPRATAGNVHPTKKLTKDWIRWAVGLPETTGPINDPTGAQCALGQDGNVWFLAGTFGGSATRECTIPEGKKLYFPLVNWFWLFDEVDEEYLEAQVAAIDTLFSENTCALTLRIDGEDVIEGGLDEMMDELMIEVTNPFKGTVDDSWLTGTGLPGGTYDLVSMGYYARIHPLDPGDHVLELGGRICDGEQTWFQTSVTYNLHIGG